MQLVQSTEEKQAGKENVSWPNVLSLGLAGR
jgi:hypothetical protein